MKVYENQAIANWAIAEVQRKMAERSDRGPDSPLHASELYQCTRKTILARRSPHAYGKDAILRFAAGFAMQEWFLGPEQDGESVLNVIFSADRVVQGHVLEFKTTRKSLEQYQKDERGKLMKDVPKLRFDPTQNDQWIARTRAYCAVHNVARAHIIVFFLFASDLAAWTLEFDQDELAKTLRDIDGRRTTLERFLRDPALPPVTTRFGDWECGLCPYQAEHCLTGWKDE